MNQLFSNFITTLRRYKVVSALNIVGLGVALAAFIAIMMQVHYDLSYDRFHKNEDRIFRVEVGTSTYLSRPMTRALAKNSPQIERSGLLVSWSKLKLSTDNQNFLEQRLMYYTPSILHYYTHRHTAKLSCRRR